MWTEVSFVSSAVFSHSEKVQWFVMDAWMYVTCRTRNHTSFIILPCIQSNIVHLCDWKSSFSQSSSFECSVSTEDGLEKDRRLLCLKQWSAHDIEKTQLLRIKAENPSTKCRAYLYISTTFPKIVELCKMQKHTCILLMTYLLWQLSQGPNHKCWRYRWLCRSWSDPFVWSERDRGEIGWRNGEDQPLVPLDGPCAWLGLRRVTTLRFVWSDFIWATGISVRWCLLYIIIE